MTLAMRPTHIIVVDQPVVGVQGFWSDQRSKPGSTQVNGHFIGIEFVADRKTKTAFDPALQFTERFRARTLEAGLICYPVSGTIDGASGDVAIIAPPYNATRAELDEIIDKLAKGAARALADINAA